MKTSPVLRDRTRSSGTAGHRTRLGATTLWLLIVGLSVRLGTGSVVEGATVTLAWDPPTNNVDGTPLTDVAGYNCYGTASRTYSMIVNVGNVTTTTVSGLQNGQTYFFAGTAYNLAGLESGFSEELLWTAPGLVSVDHFAWGPISSPQTAGVPFNVSVIAQDTNNAAVATFGGSVSLSGLTEGSATIGTGTKVADTPMKTTYDDVRTEAIYLTNEVGRAGWITALALNVSTAPGQTLENWTLRLKHTALQGYTSSSTWESNGWTTVYQEDATVTATGWVNFTFATPFYYNGTNNLMVDFSFNNTNHGRRAGYCRHTTVSSDRRLYGRVNGTTYGDPLNWSGSTPAPYVSAAIPNIRLLVTGSVAIAPANAAGFVNGIWTGSITVAAPATSLVLWADDGAGHSGAGNAFDVVGAVSAPPGSSPMMLSAPATPPAADSDDDGMTDNSELLAGTDPYDPNSALKMNRPYRPTGAGETGIVVEWTSVTGVYYTVERSTNLMAVSAFTSIVSHVTGQSPIAVYRDTTVTGSGPYYYRVRVEP